MYLSQVFSAKNKRVYSVVCTIVLLLLFQRAFQENNNKTEIKIKEMISQIGELPTFAFTLVGFVFFLFPLFFIVKKIHKQTITQFTTSRKKIDFKRIAFSFLIYGGFITGIFFLEYFMNPSDYVWNFQPLQFFILCIMALILLPIQIGFEEYFFRGYFMQWLGLLSKNRWIPLFISSILFGLAHFANPEVSKMGYRIMFFYIGMGFLLGIVSLMDDGLELALGIHFTNNFLACILSTSDWAVFQTPSLFKELSTPGIEFHHIILMFIVYFLIIFIFSKKYKWTSWREKLLGKIEIPQIKNQQN